MFQLFNVVASQLLLLQAVSEMILVLQSVPKQENQMEKGHNGHLLAPPVVNVSMTHTEWLIIHIFSNKFVNGKGLQIEWSSSLLKTRFNKQ